jgi:Thioredoxin
MDGLLARAGVIALLSLVTWAIISLARASIERRRRRALAALPFAPAQLGAVGQSNMDRGAGRVTVRILVFSSDDCVQCHRLQAPALERVKALRGERVMVTEIDAPSSPELTRRYEVLTLPTTVVLTPDGRAHAINYGFASSDRLVRQVDAVAAEAPQT